MTEKSTGNPESGSGELLAAALDVAFFKIEPIDLLESCDVGLPNQFIVNGIWYASKWGCDSLQVFIDKLNGT